MHTNAASYESWDPLTAKALIADVQALDGALLPAFHALQDRFGYVHADAIPLLAEALNISRAEVHGALSFYHYFRTSPPGAKTIRICVAEACQAVQCERLLAHAKQRLACDVHETSRDGEATLEVVYCLGNCATGPSMMIDKILYGRVTPARFDGILAEHD